MLEIWFDNGISYSLIVVVGNFNYKNTIFLGKCK